MNRTAGNILGFLRRRTQREELTRFACPATAENGSTDAASTGEKVQSIGLVHGRQDVHIVQHVKRNSLTGSHRYILGNQLRITRERGVSNIQQSNSNVTHHRAR